MSMLPSCTCPRFGQYSEHCPRHRGSALWWKRRMEERENELRNLRQRLLTRPVHGGYPDVPAAGVTGTLNGGPDGA